MIVSSRTVPILVQLRATAPSGAVVLGKRAATASVWQSEQAGERQSGGDGDRTMEAKALRGRWISLSGRAGGSRDGPGWLGFYAWPGVRPQAGIAVGRLTFKTGS